MKPSPPMWVTIAISVGAYPLGVSCLLFIPSHTLANHTSLVGVTAGLSASAISILCLGLATRYYGRTRCVECQTRKALWKAGLCSQCDDKGRQAALADEVVIYTSPNGMVIAGTRYGKTIDSNWIPDDLPKDCKL